MSSRGSCDALTGALVLLVLRLLMCRQLRSAALVYVSPRFLRPPGIDLMFELNKSVPLCSYGFCVHFRLYPVIYAPAFLMAIEPEVFGSPRRVAEEEAPFPRALSVEPV